MSHCFQYLGLTYCPYEILCKDAGKNVEGKEALTGVRLKWKRHRDVSQSQEDGDLKQPWLDVRKPWPYSLNTN